MTRLAKAFFAFFSISFLVSCGTPVSVVESNVATFVKLDRPIKFGNEVYTPEESFRLIDLSEGQRGVVFGIKHMAMGSIKHGVTVDNNLCFDRKYLWFDLWWRVSDNLSRYAPEMSKSFCFTTEGVFDMSK